MEFPSTLVERLKQGKIVPFVGAGVPRSVTAKNSAEPLFPSWRELLERAATRLEKENKADYSLLVQSLLRINKPDFLRAAEYAKNALGSIWYDFLKDQFDHRREAAEDNSLKNASEIWNLGSKLIITTNYDRVLRWTCPEPVDLGIWNIEAPAEQAIMVREGLDKPVIWYLHGNIDDATNMILTPDSYESLYPSLGIKSRFSAGLETLRVLIASRSFLFIGFSLEDERFGLQLKAVSETFVGATGPHYALICSKNLDATRALKLPNIELVPFSDYGDPFHETLVKLADEIPSTVISSSEANVVSLEIDLNPLTTGISSAYIDGCDTPPSTENWIGRNEELDQLKDNSLKVISVTGIGGQGKSSLVARYLSILSDKDVFWDWRDCKEESNTLHTNLVRIIERITKGARRASDLVGETIDSVIKLFFNLTVSMNGVFVFDNIDQYVDVHRMLTVEAMHVFIQGALKSAGRSRYIFTSRPKLSYESPLYFQIELHGLSESETYDLFTARGLNLTREQNHEVHELTQGHPLWINLIATQVVKNRADIHDLVGRIKTGKASGLPNAMLREIWQTLNPKQQKLLRYLAEAVRPETENQIGQYVSRDLNYNQFTKALNQLKALDLVVVKSPPGTIYTIELHPLIREFVRRQFSASERNPYIATIIIFLDKIIISLRSRPETEISYNDLQAWVAKIELLINSGDANAAIVVLEEARRPLLKRGYAEEFVRLTIATLSISDWSKSQLLEAQSYDDIVKTLVEILSQLGRFSEALDYIKLFEQTVPGATARYVCLCQMRANCYWLQEQFELAKEWGKRGVDLKQEGQLDTRHDCSHDLALAQRDSGEVDAALSYFLHGHSLQSVVDPHSLGPNRGGSFFGNIGRTLYFKQDYSNALVCLLKSALLLEKAKDELVLVNQGFAAFWIGELLQREGKNDLAFICFRQATNKWALVSPPRSEKAALAANRIASLVDAGHKNLEDWQIERQYTDWLGKNRPFA